jgi:hypothetical protein
VPRVRPQQGERSLAHLLRLRAGRDYGADADGRVQAPGAHESSSLMRRMAASCVSWSRGTVVAAQLRGERELAQQRQERRGFLAVLAGGGAGALEHLRPARPALRGERVAHRRPSRREAMNASTSAGSYR